MACVLGAAILGRSLPHPVHLGETTVGEVGTGPAVVRLGRAHTPPLRVSVRTPGDVQRSRAVAMGFVA